METIDPVELLPAALAATIPPLYATEHVRDPTVLVKFFTADSSWIWYVTEFDPQACLCFGLVIGQDRLFSYFTLEELEYANGMFGLPVERDMDFTPRLLSQCEGGRA